jgi:hypothetical protein
VHLTTVSDRCSTLKLLARELVMFSQSTGGCFGQFALEESLDHFGD